MPAVERQVSRIELSRQLDHYRSLRQRVVDTGEAYPGEEAMLQTHIKCVSRILELQDRDPANDTH
jgi:hypothetical protein